MACLTQMPGHHIFSNACSRYVDRPRRSSGPLEGQSPVAQVGMLTGFVSFAQQGRRTCVSLACLRLQWRAGRQYSCSPEPTIACFLVKISPCYADSFVGPTPSLLGTVWVQKHSHHYAIRLSSRIRDEADSHSHGVGTSILWPKSEATRNASADPSLYACVWLSYLHQIGQLQLRLK